MFDATYRLQTFQSSVVKAIALMVAIVPITVAKASPAQLASDPNPLELPQQPAEVKITENKLLSLDDAIKTAEENNHNLKIAILISEQNRFGLKQTKTAKLPVLRASGSLFRTEDSNFSVTPLSIPINGAEQGAVQARTTSNAALIRSDSRFEFSLLLQRLQLQLQQNQDLTRQDTVDQQLIELQSRAASTATLPQTSVFTPFSPFQSFGTTSSGDPDDGINNTIQADLTLSYNITTGGLRPASIRIAENQLKLSELDVERIRRDLRLTVTRDYYDLQEVRALLRVALESYKNATATLTNTIAREEAGLATKFEQLQAEVAQANAQQNVILAEGLQQIAQRQIAETLNLPPNVNLIPTLVIPLGEWPASLPESIVLALKNRVELDQILLTRDIAQDQKEIARSAKRPRLSTFARVAATGSDVEFRTGPDPGNQGDVNYAVGVQVNLDAFNGGETQAQIEAEETNIKIAETQFADQKNEIRADVESSYFSLQSNKENIATSRRAVEQAQLSLELAQLRLEAGIGTQLDVIQAQTDLVEAEGNVISAVLDYNRALAALQRETSGQIQLQPFVEVPSETGI